MGPYVYYTYCMHCLIARASEASVRSRSGPYVQLCVCVAGLGARVRPGNYAESGLAKQRRCRLGCQVQQMERIGDESRAEAVRLEQAVVPERHDDEQEAALFDARALILVVQKYEQMHGTGYARTGRSDLRAAASIRSGAARCSKTCSITTAVAAGAEPDSFGHSSAASVALASAEFRGGGRRKKSCPMCGKRRWIREKSRQLPHISYPSVSHCPVARAVVRKNPAAEPTSTSSGRRSFWRAG